MLFFTAIVGGLLLMTTLAEAYSRFIKAPHVEFVPIRGAGHYAFMTRSEWFLNFLVQHVPR